LLRPAVDAAEITGDGDPAGDLQPDVQEVSS
jgi:hypothetical protein